jgi:hypothetical protein
VTLCEELEHSDEPASSLAPLVAQARGELGRVQDALAADVAGSQ